MTDLTDAPRLPDAYAGYHDNATDEAAYAAMLARVAQQQPAPGGTAPSAQPGLERTRFTEPPPAAAAARSTAPSEEMIQAEIGRLQAEPANAAKFANPAAARAAAMQNLGAAANEEAPRGTPAGPTLEEAQRQGPEGLKLYMAARSAVPGLAQRAVADIGMGSRDFMFRSLYGGWHAALRNTLNEISEAGDSLNLEKWGLGAIDRTLVHDMEGWHLLTGEERDALTAAGHPIRLGEDLPLKPLDPRSVTGNIVKSVFQFTTSMSLAGAEMKAFGLPIQPLRNAITGDWAARGLQSMRGFLAMFEGFDGAQHRPSEE